MRDCHFAGVVKVSFDAVRLMHLAQVGRADGRLQICFPIKCVHEVLHVFQTRYNLHQELYQHRVSAAVGLMLRDALLLADDKVPVHVGEEPPLRLSECGTARDPELEGFVQLTDAVIFMLEAESRRSQDPQLQRAAGILGRLHRRELYRFVGSVVLEPHEVAKGWGSFEGRRELARQIQLIASDIAREGPHTIGSPAEDWLEDDVLCVDLRRVHYGCGEHNPLDNIRFFDNKQQPATCVPVARRLPESTYTVSLPRSFQEASLRVFVRTRTSPSDVQHARAAFTDWCRANNCMNEPK